MGWGWWGALGWLVGLSVDWFARCAPTRLWSGILRRRSLPAAWRLLAAGSLALAWALVWAEPAALSQHITLTVWLTGLLLLALLDLHYHLLPYAGSLTLTGITLAAHFSQSTALGVWSALGALSGGLFLWLIYRAARLAYGAPALGFGDVLLGLTLGAMTGPVGLWLALAVGMGIGGAAALVWRLRGAPTHARLPYGACLIAGAMAVELGRLMLGS